MPGLSDRTQLLVDQYKESEKDWSDWKKARMEQSIWDSLTDKERKAAGGGRGRPEWLSKVLGVGYYVIRNRYTLLRGGVAADLLWHRIEEESMPIGTAVRLLADAKKHAQRYRCTVSVGMDYVLGKYDLLDHSTKMGGGQVKRKKPKADTLWGNIRLEVGKYAQDRLTSIDPVAARHLMEELERDLKALLDEWQSRIYRYKKQERELRVAEVSRADVIDSCGTLSMDPPPPRQPVDLKKARKQQRTLARLYHPDSHGGDEAMRPKFEAVNNAYQTLVDYNESLGERAPKLAVINGGK